MEISRIKKDTYYLYLVDRGKIKIEGYKPEVIKNPYRDVLHEDIWNKRVENYYVTKSGEV